jgi:hypothetical protein
MYAAQKRRDHVISQCVSLQKSVAGRAQLAVINQLNGATMLLRRVSVAASTASAEIRLIRYA